MKGRKELIVGLFGIVGVVALIWGFFWLKGQNIFGSDEAYTVVYKDAGGLTNSSPVTLNGVVVGSVTDAYVDSKTYKGSIIKFVVTKEGIKLPKGTKALQKASLIGTPSIELIFPDGPNYKEFYTMKDTIPADVEAGYEKEIKDRLDPLNAKVQELLGSLDSTIAAVNGIFNDNQDNLKGSLSNLEKITNNTVDITDTLSAFVNSINKSSGTIVSVANDVKSITSNLAKSNAAITAIIDSTNKFTNQLTQVDIASMSNQINDALTGVNLIINEIQNGDGTLTKLMQDSLLYDNINVMIEEATSLVENIKYHPNRYLQFAVFGGRDKGLNLDRKQEKKLERFVKDSL